MCKWKEHYLEGKDWQDRRAREDEGGTAGAKVPNVGKGVNVIVRTLYTLYSHTILSQ